MQIRIEEQVQVIFDQLFKQKQKQKSRLGQTCKDKIREKISYVGLYIIFLFFYKCSLAIFNPMFCSNAWSFASSCYYFFIFCISIQLTIPLIYTLAFIFQSLFLKLIVFSMKGKQNIDLSSNYYWKSGEPSRHPNLEFKHLPFDQANVQISPVKKNKIGDSAITNVFQQYGKSTSELCFLPNHEQKMPIQHYPHTNKNIPSSFREQLDPQSSNEWKNRYLQLHKNYELLSRKNQNKTKEMFRLQETIENQNKTIRQLEQENSELNSRYNGLLTQNQRTSRWNTNGSVNSSQEFSNCGQVNRFYVEELQRSIDNLQRENKRLSDIIMRKVKNAF